LKNVDNCFIHCWNYSGTREYWTIFRSFDLLCN